MAPHMGLQSVPTRMIARLTLAFTPFAHIFRLLRTSGSAMRALHVFYKLIVVHCISEITVFP